MKREGKNGEKGRKETGNEGRRCGKEGKPQKRKWENRERNEKLKDTAGRPIEEEKMKGRKTETGKKREKKGHDRVAEDENLRNGRKTGRRKRKGKGKRKKLKKWGKG